MKINENIEKDTAPIEDTSEWIDMVNNMKKKHNVDGMHIINYETDYPSVIIYKWGFRPYRIWDVLKSKKIMLSKERLFPMTIKFLVGKIQKEDWSIKYDFNNLSKIYENMKKDNKQRLFEITAKLDSTFKPSLNEADMPKPTNNKKGFHDDIEKDTLENKHFRKVLYTAKNMQLVLMSVKPKEDLGMEVHKPDLFFRFESGTGECIINGHTYKVKGGDSIIVPGGAAHNVINTGDKLLQLYTIYSPPNHKDGVDFVTKEEAVNAEKAGKDEVDGVTTEK